jgi:CRP-like cAMP-binding protein
MLATEVQSVFGVFRQLLPVSEQSLMRIVSNASILQIPKKTRILEIGQVCNHMYFVIKGCLRLYYQKGELEVNCFFFHENLFCTAFGSFMMQRKSNQILETLEDTVMLAITFDELQQLYVEVPEMNVLVRKILEERYTNAHDIISSYVLDNPEQRYEHFKEKYPLLVNRIAEHHIASYLGITPKSLSRLKKRIYAKKKKVT